MMLRQKIERKRTRQLGLTPRPCEFCGITYSPKTATQRYHTNDCAKEADREEARRRAFVTYHQNTQRARAKRAAWRAANRERDLAEKLAFARREAAKKMESEFLALSAQLQEKLRCKN